MSENAIYVSYAYGHAPVRGAARHHARPRPVSRRRAVGLDQPRRADDHGGGGLAFIAATRDNHLRAFDIETGTLLWKAPLPAGAQATPISYEVNGTQYVVFCAGGHGKLGTTPGDYVRRAPKEVGGEAGQLTARGREPARE